MEHAHHLTIRLVASAALVGLATTLAGCASLAAPASGEQARAGGPARISTEAHLDMARDSADLYVSGLIARARASTESDAHRQQQQAQAERYVDELERRARAAREAVGAHDDLSPTDPAH